MDHRVYWVIAMVAVCNVALGVLAVIAGLPAANGQVAVAKPEFELLHAARDGAA